MGGNQELWIAKFLTKDEIEKISLAVSRVEERTQAEVVPMIVRQSSPIGHVRVIVFLLLFLGLTLFEVYFNFFMGYSEYWPFLMFFISGVLGQILSQFDCIKRIFTSNEDEILSVDRRAQVEFANLKLSRAESRSAVLIFVSIMERRAVILADEEAFKMVGQGPLDLALQELVKHLHKNQWQLGFINCLNKLDVILSEKFPVKPNDVNEISNCLVIQY